MPVVALTMQEKAVMREHRKYWSLSCIQKSECETNSRIGVFLASPAIGFESTMNEEDQHFICHNGSYSPFREGLG